MYDNQAMADARHTPILLIDIAGFTAEYDGRPRKRAVMRDLQNMLTESARFFMPFGDVWPKWRRRARGELRKRTVAPQPTPLP